MSASEIILAASAAAAGIAAGSLGVYFYSRSSSASQSPLLDKVPQTASDLKPAENSEIQPSSIATVSNPGRSIPKSELDKSKQDLRTLLVEKDMVSAALTRLYEMEAAKEITKSEREILGAKYVVELKSLDEKITKIDAFIQIGDLETLRNQLMQLVEQKIDSIDRRIESTRKLAEPLIAEMVKKQQLSPPVIQPRVTVDESQRGTPIPDISDMLQNQKPEPRIDPIAEQPMVVAAPIITTEPSKSASLTMPPERKRPADKVEELQKEILEALDRLERLDVDTA